MRSTHLTMAFALCFLSQLLFGKAVVVGIEPRPVRTMAFIFTPIVIPDLISAKAAFEYRLHNKFNLVIPIEFKWMDYRRVIKAGSSIFGYDSNVPELWYRDDAGARSWNIDFSHTKVSTGVGLKWIVFSQSMKNGFFVKSNLMVGIERFNAYSAEGIKVGAVFTQVFSIGYTWIKSSGFNIGFEIGEEYKWHTNPIEFLPVFIGGIMPFAQMSVGFTL